ncbi:MAG: hypothetical protein ACR2I1_04770 [Propionibacteriaceae bacterium]
MRGSLIKTVLSMGAFVAIGCLWAMYFVRHDPSAFVISVVGLVLGIGVMAAAVLLARRDLRRAAIKEETK